jgi:hypothetical protein
VRDQLNFSFIDDDKILVIDELNEKLIESSPSKLKLGFLNLKNTDIDEIKNENNVNT